MRRPVVYTLGGYLAGACAAHLWRIAPVTAFFLALSLFTCYLGALVLGRARQLRDPLLMGFYVAVCCLNSTARERPLRPLSADLLEAEEVLVFAQVKGEYRESYGRMRFTVFSDSIHMDRFCFRIQAKMLVTTPTLHPPPLVGDTWSLRGRIGEARGITNPGGFDWRAYYVRQGTIYTLKCAKGGAQRTGHTRSPSTVIPELTSIVRRKIRHIFETHIRGDEAALLSALLLGERSAVDRSTIAAFTESGVMHILAVSGLHVGIIWLALVVLLRVLRTPRRLVFVISTSVLIAYCFLVGHRPPVVRATIVLGSFSLTALMERELDSGNGLAVAAFIILLFNPRHMYDAGFQLSFMCAISIVRLYGLARSAFVGFFSNRRPRALKWLASSLLVSASAQLGSIPLVMYHFNRVALAPLVANLLVVPLASVDLCLGMVVSILGLLRVPFIELAAAANWFSLRLTLFCTRFFSAIPLSSIRTARPQIIWIFAWYTLVLLLPSFKTSRKVRFACLLVCLVVLNCGVWDSALLVQNPSLSAAFLDVGQGDCSVLETRSGRTIIVDAGPAFGAVDSGERVLGPFLWDRGIRRIDALVLTHPHNDHIGGMGFILDNFKVEMVLDAGIPVASKAYLKFLKSIRNRGIEYRILRRGMGFELGECRLEVLHPDGKTAEIARALPRFDPNDASVVLNITCGRISLLLTGDVNERVGDALESIDEISLLKAPHHGSEWPNRAILEMGLVPSAVIFSVGAGNRFGFPSDGIVAEYEEAGTQVFRTDRDGCTFFTTDGEGFKTVPSIELRRMSPFKRFLRRYGL